MINSLSDSNPKKISEMIDQAIKERWQLVLIIDDYTIIHRRRRPTKTDRPSVFKSMCTIIVKFFKTIKALQAIDIEACVNTLSGPVSMHKLSLTYSSTMPPWIKKAFFNPELERHQYCESDPVESMRQMNDVNFVDFVQLTLKSKNDFDAAFDILLNTNLMDYTKHFILPQLGDWPAQFYCRQIVYEILPANLNHTPAFLCYRSLH